MCDICCSLEIDIRLLDTFDIVFFENKYASENLKSKNFVSKYRRNSKSFYSNWNRFRPIRIRSES